MKNKESLENFNETAAMLKDTVRPLFNAYRSLVNHEPREELFYYLFPVICLIIGARHGDKCWLKVNAFLSLFYGLAMFFIPQFLLKVTVNFLLLSPRSFISSVNWLTLLISSKVKSTPE